MAGKIGISIVFLIIIITFSREAVAEDAVIGTIKTAKGNAFILRAGQTRLASEGMRLFERDSLKTGDAGSLAAILRDDSRLTLGANAEISIDHFVFEPAQKKMNLVLRMVRGVASYASGKIGELSPESVEFQTPVGIIGTRGTHFAVKLATQPATETR
jgi:hypothetical protein